MKAFIWIVRILLALVLLVLLVAGGALLYSSSVKQESPPTLLGYAPFTVANGEMTPSLYPGDLAILRMGSQCQPGDIVAFQQDGELLLRRIVGTSEGMYITQQEAFGQPDVNLLDPARVVAVCTTFLPGCGALAAFLYSPAGLAVLVVLGLALLLVPILLSRGTARLEGPLVDYGGEDPYEAPVSRGSREQARFAEDEEEAPPPRREGIPPRREGIPPRQESTAQEKPLIAMLEESPAEPPAKPRPSRQEGASQRRESVSPAEAAGIISPGTEAIIKPGKNSCLPAPASQGPCAPGCPGFAGGRAPPGARRWGGAAAEGFFAVFPGKPSSHFQKGGPSMEQRELPKKYKKDFPHSYALGPFPTFELLSHRPKAVRAVYFREDFREREKLLSRCEKLGVPCLLWPRALERIAQKEACYAAGEFLKYPGALQPGAPHAALVEPSDMGNLGTIMRTLLGFGVRNLALIGGGADQWHPKVVRASMGACFQLETERFDDFPAYLQAHGQGREIFPFMLDGGRVLTPESCPQSPCYTLVFGNEAAGLPPVYQTYGQSLFIPQSSAVDSLNLAVSVAIGTFLFTQKNPAGMEK